MVGNRRHSHSGVIHIIIIISSMLEAWLGVEGNFIFAQELGAFMSSDGRNFYLSERWRTDWVAGETDEKWLPCRRLSVILYVQVERCKSWIVPWNLSCFWGFEHLVFMKSERAQRKELYIHFRLQFSTNHL